MCHPKEMTISDDYPYYDEPMTETGLVIPSPETKIEDAFHFIVQAIRNAKKSEIMPSESETFCFTGDSTK